MYSRFTCNICGTENAADPDTIHRELTVCGTCGSNARFRAIVAALGLGLTGKLAPLPQWKPDRTLRGWGCSDSPVYADKLAGLFSYANTYFHAEPRVDVGDASTLANHGNSRFILCSDVLEHVLTDPGAAIRNLHDALAPGGCLVLSAPTYDMAETVEKYPSLRTYTVVPIAGRHAVVYETTAGALGFDPDPAFHGGPGSVLEMRLFSHGALLRAVRQAGFSRAETLGDEALQYGAAWPRVVQRTDVPVPMDGRIIWAVK